VIHLGMAALGAALYAIHPHAFLTYACLTTLGGLAVIFGVLR
jgi:hypothetical protein